jgi:hypothetical protein
MVIMEIFKSKWFLYVGIPLIILVVLYFLGRKSVHAEIILKAAPENVWNILMDKASYKEWNTVLIPISGDLSVGSTVEYEFHQDENTKSVIPSKVKKLMKNELLNQGGGLPGVLTYNHKYILEAHSKGTKLIIHEDYRGIGVPFWNPAPVQKAYERLCQNLKTRAEQ